MDLAPVRAQALGIAVAVMGVPITVTVEGLAPVTGIRGIWMTDVTRDEPSGSSAPRREEQKVLMIRRVDVDGIPRGTKVQAPLVESGAALDWVVDGTLLVEGDQTRVILVPDPEA